MKKFLIIIMSLLCLTLTSCVDNMFKDVYNLIYDEGMYSCYVDTPDESNISYIEVEILEVSEYEASQFNNSFKQNLKYVTGENKERYFKANMQLTYINGEEEIINLYSAYYPEQYDTIGFGVDNNEQINGVRIRFTYNGNLATGEYEGKRSNGLEVLLSIGSTSLFLHNYDLSNFKTYHTHGIHKGDYLKDLIASEQSTCIKHGYKQTKCEECDYEIVERLPKVIHKYENGKCIWCHTEKYPAHYFYTGYDEDREAETKVIISNEELQQCFLDTEFIDLSKDEIMDTYNDTYFENKSLVYISYWTNSSIEYNVTKTEIKDGKVNVYLDVLSPYYQEEDYILINILVEIDCKSDENTELNIIEKIIRLKEYQTFEN